METGSLKSSGFHWLSLNSPSLAELLLGKEKKPHFLRLATVK